MAKSLISRGNRFDARHFHGLAPILEPMAQLIVTFDPKGLDVFHRAADALATPDKLDRAVHEGIRQAGDKMRTMVRRSLHEQMGTKAYGTVVKATRSYIPERFAYAIDGQGKGEYIDQYKGVKANVTIPADRFNWRRHWKVQPRTAGGRFGKIPDSMSPKTGGVTASPWNVAHAFQRSFVDSEGTFRALIKGDTKSGMKRRKLRGPGAWKEIVRGQTIATFEANAPRLMDEYVGRRLARLLP